MQRKDTIFNPVLVENSRPVNEDVFIIKENHLLFILRAIETFKVQERKQDILVEGWYV